MERRYYSSESLAHALTELETRYGVGSEAFYAGFASGETHGAPRPIANLWAGLWEEHERVSALERSLARGVEKLVAIA